MIRLNASFFVFVVAALTVLVIPWRPAMAGDAPPRTVSLQGSGKVDVEPDLARLTAGVLTEAKTAREALTKNTRRMAAIIEAFKAAGLRQSDIRTSNFSVRPRYFHERTDNGSRPPRIVGYEVRNQVDVVVRDLSILGRVLDKSVDVGANTISGPTFGLSDHKGVKDEARSLAAADARRKADLYAEAFGVTLGPILSISEGQIHVPQKRVFARAAMADVAESAPVPIEGGDIGVSAQVSVTWSLAD